MIYYLMWGVMTGFHKEIPFCWSGILSLRQIGVLAFLNNCLKNSSGSINDIAEVAERSAVVNHAQLVGEYDVTIHVLMYDWSTPRCITSDFRLIIQVRYLSRMQVMT